ncbi:MAG: gamma carbonic anhydrase family protein, partial [Gemmatimonadaceae bacterium]
MTAPTIHPTAFVHAGAYVIGDVTLGARVSVWPTAVLRGDTAPIVVGSESNVQDGAVVHVDAGVPCTIGARVAIGHRAIVHGATVGDDCLIGMGAILLNRVRVGHGSIIGACAV